MSTRPGVASPAGSVAGQTTGSPFVEGRKPAGEIVRLPLARCFFACSVVAALGTPPGVGHAADDPARPPAGAASGVKPVDVVTLVGTGIEVVNRPQAKEPAASEPEVLLRDEIRVPVTGLPALLAQEKASTSKGRIVLFLDGRPILGASPFPPLNPDDHKLAFVLQRNEASRDAWTHLLGKPGFADRPVEVSIGLSDQYPVATSAKVWFRAIPTDGFLLLASRSNLLRDAGPAPGPGQRKPYSLAKTQAMWWFFLVLASYLFIGLITGDYGSTINATALSLMGISVATTVGGAIIDSGSRSNPAAALNAAATANVTAASAAHAANVANQIDAAATTPNSAAAAASAAATANVAATAAATANATAAAAAIGPTPQVAAAHWWLDILSDDTGVNFHRFQMVAWTLVLGVIFVHDVYVDLAMPIFDAPLLGLLGISSGTYLGLKVVSEK
jgi:hypothetical protein